MAKNFVKRQLTTADIPFPFSEGNKKNFKIINPELDEDMLSILFHKAVFELETAYLEEYCEGKPEAEAYIKKHGGSWKIYCFNELQHKMAESIQLMQKLKSVQQEEACPF